MDSRTLDAQQRLTIQRPVIAWAGSYAADEVVPWHSHERAQLLYAVDGVMRIVTPQSVWTIPSQRALWVPAHVAHESIMMSPVEMRTLYVMPEVLTLAGNSCKAIAVSRLLRELVLALLEEPVEYPPAGRADQIAALILTEIGRASTQAVDIPWPQDRRLQRVCSRVMNSPGTAYRIEDLADIAGASVRTLIRLFPRETGLKYRQWVQQVHLAEALCRLARGEGVARIAQFLGYSSPSAFTAMFKRSFGVSPNQYFHSPD